MAIRNTSTSYGSVSKWFHWIVAVLVIGMLVYGYFLGDIPKQYKGLAINIHKLTGLLILTLIILRLVWATFNVKPFLPYDPLPWQRVVEYVVHYGLYCLLIAMPLAGWIGAVTAGHPPRLGEVVFNLPLNLNKAVVHIAFQIHSLLAIALIVFVSLHILAALYHHFIKKDEVLRCMLPG